MLRFIPNDFAVGGLHRWRDIKPIRNAISKWNRHADILCARKYFKTAHKQASIANKEIEEECGSISCSIFTISCCTSQVQERKKKKGKQTKKSSEASHTLPPRVHSMSLKKLVENTRRASELCWYWQQKCTQLFSLSKRMFFQIFQSQPPWSHNEFTSLQSLQPEHSKESKAPLPNLQI